MRTSAIFGAKTSRFFEIYGVSARTREGGWASVDKGGGDHFSQICADVLYGRLL